MRRSRGAALVTMLVLLVVTWTALAAALLALVSQGKAAGRLHMAAVALGLAEGGAAKGLWEAARSAAYKGEDDVPLGAGTFSVSIRREAGAVVVTATGWVPRKAGARFSQSVRIVAAPGGAVLSWQKL